MTKIFCEIIIAVVVKADVAVSLVLLTLLLLLL